MFSSWVQADRSVDESAHSSKKTLLRSGTVQISPDGGTRPVFMLVYQFWVHLR